MYSLFDRAEDDAAIELIKIIEKILSNDFKFAARRVSNNPVKVYKGTPTYLEHFIMTKNLIVRRLIQLIKKKYFIKTLSNYNRKIKSMASATNIYYPSRTCKIHFYEFQ